MGILVDSYIYSFYFVDFAQHFCKFGTFVSQKMLTFAP